MKTYTLTPQERAVIEEAFQPFLQCVTVVAKLRGLNPALAQLTGDRSAFVVNDDAPNVWPPSSDVHESNGIEKFR